MFYGLSKLEEDFHVHYLHKAVLLAPCFVYYIPPVERRPWLVNHYWFTDFGVYAINGPNWDKDLQTICDNYDRETCKHYTDLTGC